MTLGGSGAVIFGAASVAQPLLLAAAVAVPTIALIPVVTVWIAVISDGVAFPFLLAGSRSTAVNLGVLFSVILALPAVLLRRNYNPPVLLVAATMMSLTITGVLVALFTLQLPQLLSGVRYVLVPLAVAILASTLTHRQVRILLKAVTVLMTISFIAANIETQLGSDRLLEVTNLDYGVSIRNFGEALRAPGTFATNFHLGAFSSVVAVVALVWWGALDGARKDVLWRIVALGSAVGCLALSTYRTGVVLLVTSVLAAVLFGGSAVGRWVKVIIATVGIGVGVGFLAAGLGDTKSLFQRIGIWQDLLSESPALFGHGVGYAGAASGATGATHIYTDNYFITLWLQYGVLGLGFIAILVVILFGLLRIGRRGYPRATLAASLWTGVLVAFNFVEFWEYTSAMCVVAVVIATSVPRHQRKELT